MGGCNSCRSHSLSSVPQSPEIEFPPSIPLATAPINHPNKAETALIGGNLGLSYSTGQPIKGIRKLNPRRSHFLFHSKHHVTFQTPELASTTVEEPHLHRWSPISTPTRRVQLRSSPIITQIQEISTPTQTTGTNPPATTNGRSKMGNSIQKPTRRSSFRTEVNQTVSKSIVSKSKSLGSGIGNPQLPCSKSTTSVVSGDRLNNNQQSRRLNEFQSASEDLLNRNLSSVTIQQLNASRQEKNLLRSRFFSESLTSESAVMSSNTKNKGLSTGRALNVPSKGKRTFQYQPPSNSNLNVSSVPTVPNLPVSIPNTHSRLPHTVNTNARVPQSKSAAPLTTATTGPPPPLLSFPRRYNFSSEASIAAGDKVKGALLNGSLTGFGWLPKSKTNYRVAADSQVVKPIPSKPFFLLSGSDGIGSQRTFTLDAKQKQNIPKSTRIPSRMDWNVPQPQSISIRVPSTKSSLVKREVNNDLYKSEECAEKISAPAPGLETTSNTSIAVGKVMVTKEMDLDSFSIKSGELDSGSVKSLHVGGEQGQAINRPRSGRSLSRERDTPISDSEYLIDDEISDQPELTFNFKDSSLVPLSRSSSEESLLPFDTTVHLPGSDSENGTRDRIEFPPEEPHSMTSDSAFSDVSSKPQEPITKPRKSIGKTIPPTPTSTTSIRKTTLPGHDSRLAQPKVITRTPIQNKSEPHTQRLTQKFPQRQPQLTASSNKGINLSPQKKPSPTSSIVSYSLQKTPKTSLSSPAIKKFPQKSVVVGSEIRRNRVSLSHPINSKNSKSKEEIPLPLSNEFVGDILTNFVEMRQQLEELQLALEESQKADAEKEKIMYKLRVEVEAMRMRKCPCGRSYMDAEELPHSPQKS